MKGTHLTADLSLCECDAVWLIDASKLGAVCADLVSKSGLKLENSLFHSFPALEGGKPGGVTAAMLLAESHCCVHTWPELRAVTLDVYVCDYQMDNSAKAHALLEQMIALFAPLQVKRQQLKRG